MGNGDKIILDCGEAEKQEARRLIDELNTHKGPKELASWNRQVEGFLTFAAISRLRRPINEQGRR